MTSIQFQFSVFRDPKMSGTSDINTSSASAQQSSVFSATRSSQRQQEPSSQNKKRKVTSEVCEYFKRCEVNDKIRLQCSVSSCSQNFSINCSTSTLKKHLMRHGFFSDQVQTRFNIDGSIGKENLNKPTKEIQKKILSKSMFLDCGCISPILNC